MLARVRLDADPPPTADQIREAVAVSTIDRAQAASLDFTQEDEQELRLWLSGESQAVPT